MNINNVYQFYLRSGITTMAMNGAKNGKIKGLFLGTFF